jgi:hypothetical protein
VTTPVDIGDLLRRIEALERHAGIAYEPPPAPPMTVINWHLPEAQLHFIRCDKCGIAAVSKSHGRLVNCGSEGCPQPPMHPASGG